MVDSALLAQKVATVRDAVERVREMLPADVERFKTERTAREVVVLNLFVAVQECLSLATHWLADEGWDVPHGYREVFTTLAEHDVIEPALAARLASASGLRNLIAHRYGVLDWVRIHAIAREDLEDLLEFCAALARKAR